MLYTYSFHTDQPPNGYRTAVTCCRNLVLTDSLAFAIDFWMLPRYIPEHFGIFSRSLTTAGDNRVRCQDTRLGLAHDRLLKFMALICGFI